MSNQDRREPHAALRPKVTVSILAYNHERYIEQAIQSVLDQETSFPVEILVGEDCSPDGTRQVITDLQRRHPGRITLRAYDENVGTRRNYLDGLMQASGEYIAILDGDDYWVSTRKLADQVAFMEANPELSMCFHPVIEVPEGGGEAIIVYPRDRRARYEFRDLAEWLGIHPLSVLLRAAHRPDQMPQWFFKCPFGDWPTYVMWAQRGPVGYIDEAYGVYRLHGSGMWSDMRANRRKALETNIEMIQILLDNVVTEEDADWFIKVRARRYFDVAHELLAEGRRRDANAFVRRAWRDTGLYDRNVYPLEPLKYALAWMAPSFEQRLSDLKRRYFPAPRVRVPVDQRHREILDKAG